MATYTDRPQSRMQATPADPNQMTTEVATETRPTPSLDSALDHLMDSAVESARTMMHAAENVEARGVKILLKALARQRLHFVHQLQHYLRDQHPNVAVPHSLIGELQRGMTDMQASMTLKREGRQEIVLNEQLAQERKLLDAYHDALASAGSAGPLQARLREQAQQVEGTVTRLDEISHGDCELVARLFNNEQLGEQAVQRLRNQGFAQSDIDAVALEQLPVPAAQAVKRTQTGLKPTVIGGALSGAVVGALMGLAYALFIWFGPFTAESQSVSPALVWVASIVFAALMGTVFGYLIGRNKVEDDAFVTAQGVEEGEYLVAVFADPDRATVAENILQVHHGRELGTA